MLVHSARFKYTLVAINKEIAYFPFSCHIHLIMLQIITISHRFTTVSPYFTTINKMLERTYLQPLVRVKLLKMPKSKFKQIS